MLTIAIILSAIFASLGFVVTTSNAKYILSGYNTMSEADRAKMDIEAYVKFFRKFHIMLGATLLGGFLVLTLFSNNWAGSFMGVYPLIAYIYLAAKANKFYKGTKGQRSANYVMMAILIVVTVGISVDLYFSMQNSKITLREDNMEIRGMYGIKLKKTDIAKMEIVQSLPSISHRSNGFAAGDFAKGNFVTSDGQSIKLFVNKKVNPFLYITTKTDQIYYSSDEIPAQALLQKLQQWNSPH